MTKLSVNLNKIATLRNTRTLNIPDPLRLGRIALVAGAHGLTIHPRPDQRHIRATDVTPLALLASTFPDAEFNIEGNPFEGDYLRHCLETRPTQCTLVPDTIAQSTSDHGWNLSTDASRLEPIIARLKSAGCRVSLFMDFDSTEFPLARRLGADRVELYTEPYAKRFAAGETDAAVSDFADAARRAVDAGLDVNAGHDLNLHNLAPLIRAAPAIREVSIGHALIADALEHGLADTVRRYLSAAGNTPQST
jgi:pyridoxine 5-phosphate synthase